MGKQRRNPWNVLLFFLVIVIVAYLCKRGWDGFYTASTGVYCIAEVNTPDDPWANVHRAGGHWIKNAPSNFDKYPWWFLFRGQRPPPPWEKAYHGDGLYWIWGAPNSGNVSRPDNEEFTFYHSYNNTTGTDIKAKMYGGADNYATVTINGQQLPRFDGSLNNAYHVTLRPGNNNIQIFGQNGVASPAGVWLMITDNSDTILVKTDCTNWSTSPPAAPAPAPAAAAAAPAAAPPPPPPPPPAAPGYMPPQTVNLNPVKGKQTCVTCSPAPLLSSLPTPSIAHNVNLPHYCQRITDDGGL